MFTAFRLREYEGEGSLRIYTWPIRSVITVTAGAAAYAYLSMIIADWRGQLGPGDTLTEV